MLFFVRSIYVVTELENATKEKRKEEKYAKWVVYN